MITEKQKCIAEQAVYGDLEMAFIDDNDNIDGVFTSSIGYQECYKDVGYKPIIHPLSDLTKEITHKGYNDDKPFIPLVELAKIHFPTYTIFEMKVNQVYCGVYINEKPILFHGFNAGMIEKLGQRDLLHLLHFDTRGLIEQGEAISTDQVNPYEVDQ